MENPHRALKGPKMEDVKADNRVRDAGKQVVREAEQATRQDQDKK